MHLCITSIVSAQQYIGYNAECTTSFQHVVGVEVDEALARRQRYRSRERYLTSGIVVYSTIYTRCRSTHHIQCMCSPPMLHSILHHGYNPQRMQGIGYIYRVQRCIYTLGSLQNVRCTGLQTPDLGSRDPFIEGSSMNPMTFPTTRARGLYQGYLYRYPDTGYMGPVHVHLIYPQWGCAASISTTPQKYHTPSIPVILDVEDIVLGGYCSKHI